MNRISYTIIYNANNIRDNMCSCTIHNPMAYKKLIVEESEKS